MIKKITLLVLVFITLTVKGQEERYTIQNLSINNHYSNFGTTFYGDEQVVYASPQKKSYIVKNVWKRNNQPFLDLYVGDIDKNGQLVNIKKFSDNLNTRFHEADVAFSKDKKTVYFSRNNYLEGKLKRDTIGIGLIQLYRAKINDAGEWVNVEPMPFNNDQYQTGHPTLSADGKTLYFISDIPGGFGKTDVYKASINADGSIGLPINLGPKINTPEREMFVSISGNDELYFSSDGRNDNIGGLDIYVSKIRNNRITEPLLLESPINSKFDDFSFILNYENRRGYFSSNREGGKGDDDIYTFIQNKPIEFECNQLLIGIVTDKNTGSLIPGALVNLMDHADKQIKSVVVGKDAYFEFKVDCNKSYQIVGSKERYTTDTQEIFTTENDTLNVNLALAMDEFKMERGKCIVKINPIYFDFDKFNIRPDAALELDKVVAVMKKYPELIIEGGSHTDSRGSFNYNVSLSTNRAISTVQYIIDHGIDSSRITAKGYGETELANGCADGVPCSEIDHQLNRRTAFVIVNSKEINGKYPEICSTVNRSSKEQNLRNQQNEFGKNGEDVLMNINNIYFELNSSLLSYNAVLELNKVVEIMLNYPGLIIECGSHTDSRASDQYNNCLSERRANRVVDYIISKGIAFDRISCKGYGESQLVNQCAEGVKFSEIEHLQNRRTEFVIKNPDVIKFK